MVTFDHVMNEYARRQSDRGTLIEYMKDARDHFNGDVIVPLPEMESNEKPAVANLMAQGLDQTSMRVASVLPSLEFPPMIYGKDKGEGSEDWAHKRHMAVSGWWQESRLNLKLRRIARWVVGYGTSPLMIRPNFDTGIPEYSLRDPLGVYPDNSDPLDYTQPNNVIYAFTKTFSWLRANYPDAARSLERKFKHTPKDSVKIELLEWNDAEERLLGVIGMRVQGQSDMWVPRSVDDWSNTAGEEIMRVPNRAGICWGVQANRITIDQLQGQFQQTFGIYQNQAELMALENIAVKKAIFPDLVMQSTTPGRTPILVNGSWADGRTGEINVVRDGNVQPIQLNPGFMTQPLIDRHERNIRSAGVPSQFSGETPSNIATGRLGNQTLSASVDFPIQEYQEIIATTLEEANKRAIAVAKAYFGDQKKSFYVSFGKQHGQADYRPNTHFETDAHFVRYSAPGADVNSLVIGIGQRIGIGTMSKWTAMQQDPMVPDALQEYRKTKSEQVQQALLDFVSQQVAQGALDPMDVVILWEELERGANIADAWRAAQKAAQERQAEAQEEAQQAQQEAGLGGPAGPEGQPGLSPPPEGEAGLSIQGPNPNQQNLAQLLGALRQPRAITSSMASENATPPQQPVG